MYNFYSKRLVQPPGCAPNILLVMKVTVLIMVTAMLQVGAKAYAQKVTLSERDAPLKVVIDKISQQTGYDFLVSTENLRQSKAVTINVRNEELTTALAKVFAAQPLSYVVQEKMVVVSKRTEAVERTGSKSVPLHIMGKVTDTAGIPIPGATVKSRQSREVTLTDKQGEFAITVADDDQIEISFIGFESFLLTGKAGLAYQFIRLKASHSKLDEVQIIAYGKTTRRLNTGNVTTVSSYDIESQPVSNVLAALEGRVPGMTVSQQSGVPGSSFNIQIRGQSALDLAYSKNDPLIIVDGVPFESGNSPTNQINSAANNPTAISSGGLSPLNTINPTDIESIEILKDADATAIYGSRGANGIILITTKKGKPGATKFNLSAYAGVNRTDRSMQMLNTEQYLQMRREAFTNDGYTVSSRSSDPGYAPDLTLWDNSRYTDFEKLLTGNTAYSQDLQTSLSGGDVINQFLISGRYHRETNVFPGKLADNIGSLHFNFSHTSLNKRLNLTFTALYSSDQNQLPRTDLTRFINLPPNLKLYDDAGNLAWQDAGVVYNSISTNTTNPLGILNQYYKSINENLLGNLQFSYKILNNLVFRTSFGYNVFQVNETNTKPSSAIDPNTTQLPSSGFAGSTSKSWIAEPQLEYTHVTVKDRLSILIGNTYQNKSGEARAMYGTNYNSDLLINSIAAAPTINGTNDFTQYRYTALFGRINYSLENRYIVNLTARRDGSSRFAPENRWSNFGAIGAAWVFINEPLLKKTLTFLSFGKLRASFGRTGNDQIGEYKFLNLWSNTPITYNGQSGLFPKSLYNSDYTWEINNKLEAAIDLGFFKDDLLLSASYYSNRSDNQLISYSLPSQTGFFSVIRNFPGLVSNTGLEVTLTTKNFHKREFSWTTGFNLTIPRNKLLAFPGLDNSSYFGRYIIGQPLSVIYALNYTGVNPQTGLYTFEDKNKDGHLTTDDYQVSGNTDPKLYGGLQNNITFKQFDLSFFFEFKKQTGLNYLNQLSGTPPGWLYNEPSIVLSRWQKPGDISNIQRFSTDFGNAYTAISYLSLSNGKYSDASYIRLKNVSLSYRVPVSILSRYHISGCRLYLEGQNLLTITSYVGSDPETQNLFILPPLRSIVGGIQFNF